ncbi:MULTISPECIES: hypothetical protein [Acinetobacter]|uniref:Uncharacterized protein n=1 Tax=Acinetobacter indicus TaxID=756892 RepID=A0A6C0Y6Q7_9GAMM|nr:MULTISPECIES: hypothetical protein [Acinetobacter]QIC71858.1 hypothetical protein FSC09_15830 [Acinetobacter indicus]QKQ71394.1 hypothetical protein E5Y90_14280 [Acinetobacter sp. 10FS3-1]
MSIRKLSVFMRSVANTILAKLIIVVLVSYFTGYYTGLYFRPDLINFFIDSTLLYYLLPTVFGFCVWAVGGVVLLLCGLSYEQFEYNYKKLSGSGIK